MDHETCNFPVNPSFFHLFEAVSDFNLLYHIASGAL